MKRLLNTFLLTLIGGAVFSQTTVTFTSSSTFTVPAGITSLDIEVVGAGGAGGGNGGGGGGGGGYASGTYTVTPGQVLNVTVGIPGSGQAAGTSSVDMMIAATGGANGTSVSNPSIGGGGAGGVGVNGSVNRTGGSGGGGYWTYFGGGGGGAAGSISNGGTGGNTIAWTGICQTPGGAAGTGGGAPGGDGGKGAGFTDSGCNISDPSGNGLNYGGGGGGGNGNGGAPGTGVGGFVSITYGGCTVDNTTSLNSTTITANESGAMYQWINCSGNTPIAAATNQSFTPTQTGNYAVIVNNGSCSDTSSCVNVVVCNLTATTTLNGNTISAVQTGTYQWISCSLNTPVAGATSQSFTPTQTGAYAVIINDNGCIDTSECEMITLCTLNATTSVQNFTITAQQPGTYQWIDCSANTLIPNQVAVSYTPAVDGSYAVIITSGNCTDTSACVVIAGLNVENNELNSIAVFPNPFKSNVQVSNLSGNETFELMNSLGQIVFSGNDIGTEDFSHLVKGVYILRIKMDSSVRQIKLVKE